MAEKSWLYENGRVRYLHTHYTYTIEDRPLWFHLQGLSETSSGYGRKLRSPRMVRLADGRLRRVYVCIFSNSGTAYVEVDGLYYVVRD